MTEIADAFRNGKALIGFAVCGDPDIRTTKSVVRSMAENGCDLIVLDIPFSDPTAEDPAVIDANRRALDSGITTDGVFRMTGELRREGLSVPIVYKTYANVVFSYGGKSGNADGFCREASGAGAQGLILPDVPFEESGDFRPHCRKYGMDLISVIVPAPEDRIAMIAAKAEGFVCIEPSGGTGCPENGASESLASTVGTVRKNTDIPCAIVSRASSCEQAAETACFADGIMVDPVTAGTSEKSGTGPIGTLVGRLKDAIGRSPDRYSVVRPCAAGPLCRVPAGRFRRRSADHAGTSSHCA